MGHRDWSDSIGPDPGDIGRLHLESVGPGFPGGSRRFHRWAHIRLMTRRVRRDRPPVWTITLQGRGRRRLVRELRKALADEGYELADTSKGRTTVPDEARTRALEAAVGHEVRIRRAGFIRCRFVLSEDR